MLAGRLMDVVVLVTTAATVAELLADSRPVPALVAAMCGLALLARHRVPAVSIAVTFAGLLVLTAILDWHEPSGAFGLTLLAFVVAGCGPNGRRGRAGRAGWPWPPWPKTSAAARPATSC